MEAAKDIKNYMEQKTNDFTQEELIVIKALINNSSPEVLQSYENINVLNYKIQRLIDEYTDYANKYN